MLVIRRFVSFSFWKRNFLILLSVMLRNYIVIENKSYNGRIGKCFKKLSLK